MRELCEWRTLLLAGCCYLMWAFLVFSGTMPDWAATVLLIPVLTLHSSLQHEFLHGHPFRKQAMNDVLISPPIGLLVPYQRFKACHLAHHINETITDPYDDPESYYLDANVWATIPGWLKLLLTANNSLIGRIVLGPALATAGFARTEYRRIRSGDRAIAAIWLRHLVAVTLLLTLVAHVASLPLPLYVVAAYFGMGLLMVRSFIEHQAVEKTNQRSVIVETRGPLSWLFLNNNFHSVHHAYPSLAWYRIPGFFQANRARFLRMNGGYRYTSYFEVLRRHGLKPKEPVVWPLTRRRKASEQP